MFQIIYHHLLSQSQKKDSKKEAHKIVTASTKPKLLLLKVNPTRLWLR